jgi:hypothetical protein
MEWGNCRPVQAGERNADATGNSMASAGAEKRRYPRIYFPADLVVSGTIAQADTPAAGFPVTILNLSEGGLFLTLSKEKGQLFQGQNSFLFKGMIGPAPFNLAQELVMAVRWVLGNEMMANIGYGCEFVAPPSPCVEQLRGMVDHFLMDCGR